MEDLGLLENADLRAVFGQVSEPLILDALTGVSPSLRARILAKLSPDSGALWGARLHVQKPVPFETSEAAQRAMIEALCRLSRSGQVAFDDPDDIVGWC
jgi:flagellar motor switch protein FliG